MSPTQTDDARQALLLATSIKATQESHEQHIERQFVRLDATVDKIFERLDASQKESKQDRHDLANKFHVMSMDLERSVKSHFAGLEASFDTRLGTFNESIKWLNKIVYGACGTVIIGLAIVVWDFMSPRLLGH